MNKFNLVMRRLLNTRVVRFWSNVQLEYWEQKTKLLLRWNLLIYEEIILCGCL